ncbi:serine/threonine protein kinase [Legionella steigerwaltii]|uniref:Serine/threonine protein kinase n=1 Tax=Legionella steigerwaltii TaxID=460 RepID=A0A378LCQ5_9GAMM|nr:phosphotransferase [Legionella steigerwaltii]KTD78492.1 serine/threonine protein kinase [Legionella steigerwaltii]STY24150.1 serine/threonine protein kinase [Legionella steigerwaltii]
MNTKQLFEQASYLTQVRRLRALAIEALKQYPFITRKIEFIKYSANAIFRVTDHQNKRYALRINPYGHHQQAALQEEMQWIQHILTTTNLNVPVPIKTSSGQYFIEVRHPLVQTNRYCFVSEWLAGKKKWNSINEHYANKLGQLIGILHQSGRGISMPHRNYWLADGLIGAETAKFYNIEMLSEVSIQEQQVLTAARRMVYEILKEFECKHPDKTGVIHSDTQPNNILVHQGRFAIIDFDDCGLGFYHDDLAVALCAFEHVAEGNSQQSFHRLKEALLHGYSEQMPILEEDIRLLPYFMLARKLVTIAWLEARKTNPGIRYYFPTAVDRAIRFYQQI